MENLTLGRCLSSKDSFGITVEKYMLQCSFGLFLLVKYFSSLGLYDYFFPNLNSRMYSKNLTILSLPFNRFFP